MGSMYGGDTVAMLHGLTCYSDKGLALSLSS